MSQFDDNDDETLPIDFRVHEEEKPKKNIKIPSHTAARIEARKISEEKTTTTTTTSLSDVTDQQLP